MRVIARKEVEGDRDEIKKALAELRVEMQPRNGGLVVTTRYPKDQEGISSIFSWLAGDHIDANVRYEVTLPRTMNVDVSNTNGGIHLTGVAGKHELETTNGKIEVERCSGSLDASTTNGSINSDLPVATTRTSSNSLRGTINGGGTSLRMRTTNGGITIKSVS